MQVQKLDGHCSREGHLRCRPLAVLVLRRLQRVVRQQQWQPKWARTITKADEEAEALQGTVLL